MEPLIVVAIVFVQLTGPDGKQRIDVNPVEVSSVREPSEGHFAKGTHCILTMTSGKVTAVYESCETVRQRILGGPKAPCVLVCGGERP